MGITTNGTLRLINNCEKVLSKDVRTTETGLAAIMERAAERAASLLLTRLQDKVTRVTLEHHAADSEVAKVRFKFCGIGASRNEVESYDNENVA